MSATAVPYFADPTHAAALAVHAAGWERTPFRARSAVPGPRGGVDCVRLAEALLRGAGAVPAVDWPDYRIDSGSHLERSPLLEFLRGRAGPSSAALAKVLRPVRPDRALLAGDVLVLRYGRVPYHLGVALGGPDGHFVHVVTGREVEIADRRDATFARRLQAVFRSFASNGAGASSALETTAGDQP